MAELFGTGRAVVMRGNGTVVAADSVQDAVVLTWYLEDAARIELDCLAASDAVVVLTETEAKARATRSGRIFERMWDYLTHGDPE
jgi:HCOMODA/2-hydroxy-3-carboxy-muconic semialdehyde decarboxylase